MIKNKSVNNERSFIHAEMDNFLINDHSIPEVAMFIEKMKKASGDDFSQHAFEFANQSGHVSSLHIRLTEDDPFKLEAISHHVARTMKNTIDGRLHFGFDVVNVIQVLHHFCHKNRHLFSLSFDFSAFVEASCENTKWVLSINKAAPSDVNLLFECVSIIINAMRANEEIYKAWSEVAEKTPSYDDQINLYSTYVNNFFNLRGFAFKADVLRGESSLHLFNTLSKIEGLSDLRIKLNHFNAETRLFLHGYESSRAMVALNLGLNHASEIQLNVLNRKVVID